MRLIDADELLHKIRNFFWKEIEKTPTTVDEDGYEIYRDNKTINLLLTLNKGISNVINTTPILDVVRCKDCKHADECHKSVQYTRNESNSVTIGYSPIEWCSKGERREE